MEKKTSWELVYGDERSLPLIQSLFKELYNQDLTLEHLRWRFLDNPFDPAALAMAYDRIKDRLAGLFVLQPVQLSIGGQRVKGFQAVDAMTHPEYQKQGIFKYLVTNCLEHMSKKGYEILYAFPNENSFHAEIHHFNWDYTGKIPLWVRAVMPISFYPLFRYVRSAKSIIKKDVPSAENLNNFFNVLPEEKRTCSIVRSAEWLLWRYNKASGRNYHWHVLYNTEGAIKGLGIWGQYNGQKNGSLTEIWALEPKDYSILLNSMVHDATKAKVRFLKSFLQRPALEKYLWKSAFIRVPDRFSKLRLIVYGLTTKIYPGNIHYHEGWRITGGDLDVE